MDTNNLNQKNIFGQNNIFKGNKIIWKARGEGFLFAVITGIFASIIWELIKFLWKII